MKKLLSGLLILGMATGMQARQVKDECDCKVTSHTFFTDEWELVFGPTAPARLTLFRDRMEAKKDCWWGSFQAVVLGGKSTDNERLARFFLPNCKTTLTVNEDASPANPDTDILANEINIYTVNGTFSSQATFKPHHSFAGVGLQWQQAFYEREDGRALWFSVSLPIMRIHNDIQICEDIIDNGGGAATFVGATTPTTNAGSACNNNTCNTECDINPTTLLAPVGSVEAAFAQPGWCFGRIEKCSANHKTGAGDLELRIGYQIVKKDTCYLDSYVGILAPTGNRVKGRNVFEPIIGHNHHTGFLSGCSLGLEIWRPECAEGNLWFMVDMAFEYFMESVETRSFDLKNKPWSRYMQFYQNVDQALFACTASGETAFALHTPGINLLTQELRVKPGFLRDFNIGLAYNRCAWQLEAGYNFYGRQAECVELNCPFQETSALKSIASGSGETSSLYQINDIFPNNVSADSVSEYQSNIVTIADLDLDSAAHPAVVSHTFYGSFGYKWEEIEYPTFAGFGGSYEFGPDNSVMNRWMAWGKVGVSF